MSTRPSLVSEGFRLSSLQKRLWRLQDDAGAAFRVWCVASIEGPLDQARFRGAVDAALRRHEILRTTFQTMADLDLPLQVIANDTTPLIAADLSSAMAAGEAPRVEAYLRARLDEPFDVHRGPLVRVHLVACAAQHHLVAIGASALCADGRGLTILLQDILRAYEQPSRIDDEPAQYADVAEWMNDLLEGPDGEVGRDFWRRHVIEPPAMPAETPAAFAPRRLTIPLDAPGLVAGSATEMLLACWLVYLRRAQLTADAYVGLQVDGRRHASLERAMGLFAKYVPLAIEMDEASTVRAIVERVAAAMTDAAKWPECFEWQRAGSRVPATFAFGFDDTRLPAVQSAGDLTVRVCDACACLDRVGLRLECLRRDGETTIDLAWHWDAASHDEADVRRIAEGYVVLVRDAVARPDARVGDLALLGAAERQRVLVDWNLTRSRVRAELLTEGFQRQAAATPNAIAVCDADRRLTYRELHDRAAALAARLRELGVGPDRFVGVLMERSVDLPVALLGVLQAGGAYVPLDRAYPRARLEYMLQDSGANWLIADARLRADAPAFDGVLLTVEATRPATTMAPAAIHAGQAAYVIYTSGSTGRPKGVVVPHGAIANHMTWMAQRVPLRDDDGVLQKTPYSFDASVWEFWAPLLAGARLIMARPGGHQDAGYLADVIAREGVTTLQVVPTQLRMLVDDPALHTCGSLRRVFCGGDVLTRDLVEACRRRLPDVEIYNLYGPTEVTIDSVAWECRRGETGPRAHRPIETGGVPIGRPVDNIQAYVVAADLRPVPIGAIGELLLGGDGLARGYVGRPALTADRFVPHPFVADGQRLYRTGDLARWRPDGVLEYIGRRDHQVKLRGHRIELGEIESVLCAQPGVRSAVAIVREDTPGDQRLVAYVTADGAPRGADLRTTLRDRLPEAMIPSAIVVLDAMPLMPNGKLDRAALPPPTPRAHDEGESARTPVEDVVAAIWCQVLGIETTGIEDDFFEQGGHSLLATQVISRIREAFLVDVPLGTLFERPTVAALAAEIERRLPREGEGVPERIARAPRTAPLPLSFGQQRLWFIEQLTPGNTAYNIAGAVRLRGALHVDALARSLDEIVRRHEILRTTFAAGAEGEPVQMIAPSIERPFQVHDLRQLHEEAREAEVKAWARAEESRPFDLTTGPLFRVVLLRLAEQEHVLLFTTHHIISDGWSACVLVNELAVLYEDFRAGLAASLPELPVQYADYAAWQRRWLQGPVLDRQIAYWREHLEGAPAELDLPIDHPRPAVPGFRGGQRKFTLSPALSARIRSFSRASGATPFMTLLAAYAALLHRYAGADRITVGTPIAGRTRVETERLIGLFLNTLPVCTDFTGNPSFREIVRRVRAATIGAYTHQDVPFDKLVEALRPERVSSHHSPFFQVTFIYETALARAVRIPDLEFAPAETTTEGAKFDLRLGLFDTGDLFTGSIVYDVALFEAPTIERMIGHFERLLADALETPDRRVLDLGLTGTAERRAVLADWNDTDAAYSTDVTLHQLFERQVRATPEAVAVLDGAGRRWTYRHLNDVSNRVAHVLRARGAGRGACVGVYLDRRLETVAALYGVLKAGAAYVPLLPTYPLARVANVLTQAGVHHVVTDQQHGERLTAPEFAACTLDHVIAIDDDEALAEAGVDDPRQGSRPEDLAYVIFTSGSTGVPKGVVLQHRPVVNLIEWVNRTYRVGADDRVLGVSSLTFDLSVYDIFGTLATGGSLLIATDADVRNPERLLQFLMDEPITFWNSAPAVLQQLTPLLEASGRVHDRAALRLVFLSGDWIPVKLPDAIRRAFPRAHVVSLGGATEAAIWSNVFDIGTVDAEWRSIPYGRALANARYYILNPALQPCPIGVRGDLYIGGACLSSGYLGQPRVTAAAYGPDPFSAHAGARLYRTGDRARWRPDGQIEFLGRVDHQVKIRGFRIELGEIEAVLTAHTGVREAVAIVREDTPGDRRLVAYVVPQTDAGSGEPMEDEVASVDVRVLRERAKAHLPDYMIPSAFVILDRLPLSPNGKVDRPALPAPAGDAEPIGAIGALETPVERGLAQIWIDLLGRTDVDRHANFFELGGHSLLATQMMSRVREAFRIDLPLANFFEAPTLHGLAVQIEERLTRPHAGDGRIPRAPHHLEPPLSFAQQRLWFLEQLSPGTAVYSVPAAVRLSGPLNAAALERAINALVERHESLRTTFPVGASGEPFQRVTRVLPIPLETIAVSDASADARDAGLARLIAEEEQRAFDIESGPLLRTRLVRLTPDEHVLLFTMHHIVSDGWSAGVLVRELAVLYEAYTTGREPVLPELPIRYVDYAIWQREWLRGDALERQAAYWRAQLDGAPPLLALPTDHPRPAVPSHRGAQEATRVPSDITARVKAFTRGQGVTLFMTVLAAHNVVMHYLTSQTDVVVGTDIANRHRLETEGLVGFLANQLVLRTDLSANPDFLQIVGRVQRATLDAYVHQDLPFERVVEELHPQRHTSYAPLFQVKLVLQNTPNEPFNVSGLTLRDMTPERPVVKFDLLTTVWESGDELSVTMLYSTDLFTRPTIARVAALLTAALDEATARPHATLDELIASLDAADRQHREGRLRTAKAQRTDQYSAARRRVLDNSQIR